MDTTGTWILTLEPTQVVGLRGVCADEQKMLGGDAAHREIADQFASFIEHRRQSDAADGGNPVRHHLARASPRLRDL